MIRPAPWFVAFLLAFASSLGVACGGEEEETEETVEVEPDEEENEGEEGEEGAEEHAEDEEHADDDTEAPPPEGELHVGSDELILDDETRARVAPEQRGLAHILIRYRGAERAEGVTRTKAAAEALAQEAHRRVQDEDFGAVAAELSDDSANKEHGGVMGLLERGLLPEPIDDALFSMEVGEVRGPVESPLGFHVMTRTE